MATEPTAADSSPTGEATRATPTDPVLERRQRIGHWAHLAKRTGYLLWTAAVVLFFVALVAGLPRALTTSVLVCMGVGSIFLAPAIVIGYGVKAADREDTDQRVTHH